MAELKDIIAHNVLTAGSLPKIRSKVDIGGGGMSYSLYRPRPNAWWRMWQWLLLGWKWREVK